MKVIIIGNGKVGFALAQQLSGDGEDHELVLIDKNPDALRDADGMLDILCMVGSGASIQVESQEGRGTTFTVTIPIHEKSEEAQST